MKQKTKRDWYLEGFLAKNGKKTNQNQETNEEDELEVRREKRKREMVCKYMIIEAVFLFVNEWSR